MDSIIILVGLIINLTGICIIIFKLHRYIKNQNNESISKGIQFDNLSKEVGEVHKLMYETESPCELDNTVTTEVTTQISELRDKVKEVITLLSKDKVQEEEEEEITFSSPYVLSLASKYDLTFLSPCSVEGVDFIYFDHKKGRIELIVLDITNRKINFDMVSRLNRYYLHTAVLKESDLGITIGE